MLDPLTLVGARLAVLESLRRGDWEAMPLDGDVERILIAEMDTGTAWIVTVEPATLVAATGVTLDEPEALGYVREHADGCALPPDHVGPCHVRALRHHEVGCTRPDDHAPPCRDDAGADLTIPF